MVEILKETDLLDYFIENPDEIFAHLDKSQTKHETLKEHSALTLKYVQKIIKEKHLEQIIDNFGREFFGDNKELFDLFKNMFFNVFYLHDLGKTNINFQTCKMKNKKFHYIKDLPSKHSYPSAKFYFDYYFNIIDSFYGKSDRYYIIEKILFLNIYIISKHHGILYNFTKFVNDFSDKYEDICKNQDKLYRNLKKFADGYSVLEDISEYQPDFILNYKPKDLQSIISFYMYAKLLFSLLVSGDFYATYDFINGKEVKDFGILKNVDEFYSKYIENPVYKSILQYKNYKNGQGENPYTENSINELRSEMFLEAENNLEKYSANNNIFYLEAPTGSGKTNTAINLTLKLLKINKNLNKIFYVFPFNTLVEQTKSSLETCLGSEIMKKYVSVINSITPMAEKTNEVNYKEEDTNNDDDDFNKKAFLNGQKLDYEAILLDRQFIHSPIILTTHVNMFNYLFGLDREANFPLSQIANSVVVLDEIQAYRNDIWKEIITFLNAFAKTLNIKIIIMSATLPNLDKLINNSDGFVSLIEDRKKYFENPLFKDRVKVDYSLLSEFEEIEEKEEKFNILKEKVLSEYKNGKKVLVEFIKKKSAMDFYKIFLNPEEEKYNVKLLTGDDNIIDRKKIINGIKKNPSTPIVLISTQVIEAGVDIDMDAGFKDISILDAEEQFMGRINRSCNNSGVAFFFNFDDASCIYNGDARKNKEYTLTEKDIQEALQNKNFSWYYNKILNVLNETAKKNNSKNFKDFIFDEVANLNFKEIENRLKLIKQNCYTIFLNYELELENHEKLCGVDVWQQYKAILCDKAIDYAEKRVKLSQISKEMSYFTYNINKITKSFNDNIGNIFYIEDGEKYLIENSNGEKKFDREKFDGKFADFEFL